MSSISRPELSSGWWKDVKPASVRGRDLETALKAIEKAEKACKKDPLSTDGMAKAVKSLKSAVSRTTRECKDDKDVADALADLLELAEGRLEELESRGDDPLLDVHFLRDMMRWLKKAPMVFAVAVGSGDRTYLTLDRYKKGVPLMSKLKEVSGCSLATYGIASAQGKQLWLDVQGPAVSGLEKRVRDFLKDNQPLPFKQVRLGKPEEEGGDDRASARAEKAQAEAVDVARKIAKAVNKQRKKVEKEVKQTVDKLREIEKKAAEKAETDAERQAGRMRKALEDSYVEGRKKLVQVKQTAEELLEQKSKDARKALEKAARAAGKGFQDTRKKVEEGRDWLESEAPEDL